MIDIVQGGNRPNMYVICPCIDDSPALSLVKEYPVTDDRPQRQPEPSPAASEPDLIITNKDKEIYIESRPLTIRQSHALKEAKSQLVKERPNSRSAINMLRIATIQGGTWRVMGQSGGETLLKRLGELLSGELGSGVEVICYN